MITFLCKGKSCSPHQWEGTLEIIRSGNPCEAELDARGSHLNILVARNHESGNLEIGVPLLGNRSSVTRKSSFLCLITCPFLWGYLSRPCRICGA